jgi:hypothetical protein
MNLSSRRLTRDQHASLRVYLQHRPNPVRQVRRADRATANLGEQRGE